MLAIDEKVMWWPSGKNLYNLAGSFGRRLCCKLLTDPLGGVCASLAPRRRPKLQRHIHTCYFLAAPWRRKRAIDRAARAPGKINLPARRRFSQLPMPDSRPKGDWIFSMLERLLGRRPRRDRKIG